MGLLQTRGGDITFENQPLARMSAADRVALGLRLLPEGRGIFPDLSIAENITVVAARVCGPQAILEPQRRVRAVPRPR